MLYLCKSIICRTFAPTFVRAEPFAGFRKALLIVFAALAELVDALDLGSSS